MHAVVCDSQNTAMLMYSGVEAKALEEVIPAVVAVAVVVVVVVVVSCCHDRDGDGVGGACRVVCKMVQ